MNPSSNPYIIPPLISVTDTPGGSVSADLSQHTPMMHGCV